MKSRFVIEELMKHQKASVYKTTITKHPNPQTIPNGIVKHFPSVQQIFLKHRDEVGDCQISEF
jgi:hypothetical protein